MRVHPIARTIQSEWGLSAMLIFLVLSTFVALPLEAKGLLHTVIPELLFTCFVASGLFAISGRKVVTISVGVYVLIAVMMRWAAYATGWRTLAVWASALVMGAVLMFFVLVLMQAFRQGPITVDRILGAIVGYLLIGILWFEAYKLLYSFDPGAFRTALPENSTTGAHGLAYFSFVTLTTVGYGDITPFDPIARSLAVAEALIGQLYPAILIARLVSMELMSRRRD